MDLHHLLLAGLPAHSGLPRRQVQSRGHFAYVANSDSCTAANNVAVRRSRRALVLWLRWGMLSANPPVRLRPLLPKIISRILIFGTARNTFDCARRQSFCSSRGAMKLAMIADPVSPERQVYHERRICFLQFPRWGRCRPYAKRLGIHPSDEIGAKRYPNRNAGNEHP